MTPATRSLVRAGGGSGAATWKTAASGSSSRGYRWADYTIRIPSGQFQRFFEQVGELAHETWRSTNQENITEVYYDTAGRLKTQQVKLERLQTLLAQAKNMEDIITIESAISETEWNIENLSGTLRRYDSQVALSTITVNLQEVYKYSNTENVPESFGERIGQRPDPWLERLHGYRGEYSRCAGLRLDMVGTAGGHRRHRRCLLPPRTAPPTGKAEGLGGKNG